MQMKQRDEEKRSIAWRVVMLVSTAVIVLAVLFFAVNGFFRNPLEGEWFSEEKGYHLDIEDEGELSVEGTFDDVYVEVDLGYALDKREKTISLKAYPGTYQEAVEDTNGSIPAREIEESLESFVSSYYYSVDNGTLTLTDRESGNAFVFTRIKK